MTDETELRPVTWCVWIPEHQKYFIHEDGEKLKKFAEICGYEKPVPLYARAPDPVADDLAAALRDLLQVELCGLEGMQSGQPSIDDIDKAINMAEAALEKYDSRD